MKSAISAAEVECMNSAFETAEPQEILAWALERFQHRWWWPFGRYKKGVTIANGFGFEGMALTDMVIKLNPLVRIFTVDTRMLFQETYQLIERTERHYGISIERIYPLRGNVARFERLYGWNPDRTQEKVHERCCWVRKVEPFERAIQGYGAWITSVQRSQPGRSGTRILSIEPRRGGIIKICPFATWSSEQLWRYVIGHNVPYNPLHDKSYPSIGCIAPCTTPVLPGEDARAGRWRGSKKTECGIQVL
jgi:phosphoadenosine phosphosulfate reductase